VLTPTLEAAKEVARFDDRAERLAAALWPGALTMVLPRTDASMGWDLGGDGHTIGVRVPSHPLALAVLVAGGPLATTSANRSGDPPAVTCDELHAAFGDEVAVYLCQEQPMSGAASTVVDLTHRDVRVLRAGGVDAGRIEQLLGGEAPLLDSPPPG
jgi:tRNA threonylcarbamoyl adenosine modification protein (Sua5/YciO/YrdC/YwlC family)